MVEATAGTPTDRGNKAARPQGTSPMTRDVGKNDELDVQSLEVMEIDGEEVASSENDDHDSIARANDGKRGRGGGKNFTDNILAEVEQLG